MDFPEYGASPVHQLLTACEVLCWIGYKRVISKDLFFASLDKLKARPKKKENPEEVLHAAIPEPKPIVFPMGFAEAELMGALRAGKVRAFYDDQSTGVRTEVPKTDYDADVIISVRGALEPLDGVDTERHVLATRQPKRGTLWFPAADILTEWPFVPSRETVKATAASEASMRKWLCAYMKSNQNETKSKQEVRKLALSAKITDVPNRAFDRAWKSAVDESGAVAYSTSGRRAKSPH